MIAPRPKSLSIVCILLMMLVASELFLDGQKLAGSLSLPNWFSAAFHALMFLAALFTMTRKKWARNMLLIFSAIQIFSFAFSLYSLKNPRSNIGKSTFTGYVEGYLERQKANNANPASLALNNEKLDKLWLEFEKEIWPKAKTPLVAVMMGYTAIYAALLVFLLHPKTKSQFY